MLFRNIPIGSRLSIGFGIILFLAFFTAVIALRDINQIWENTESLYSHPYTVSKSVRDININILNIRRYMLEMALISDRGKLIKIQHNIDSEEARAYASFDIVFKQYLGDKEDIENWFKLFRQWKSLRDKAIKETMKGNTGNYIQIISKGNIDFVNTLLYESKKITDFASDKAATLYYQSKETKRTSFNKLLFLLIIALTLSLIFSVLITLSLRRPLLNVVKKISDIASGKLGSEKLTEGSDEIGQLAASYNMMQENLAHKAYVAERISEGYFYERVDSKGDQDLVANSINKIADAFKMIVKQARRVAVGDYNAQISSGNPKNELVIVMNQMLESLRNVVSQAREIARGDYSGEIAPKSDSDELAQALNKMTQFLSNSERELKLAKEKAEESDKLKTAFLANMSHEIRTPLNAIVGFSNLLASDEFGPGKKELYIEYINNSSEALTTLISDIIDIAKIEAGQLEMNPSPVNINNLLKEIFETFKEITKKLGKGHILLKIEIPAEKDNLVLYLDGLRFRQVITNLVTNALKFTSEGEINFGYTLNTQNNPIFFVTDTGIGIPKDKQQLIFERFRQIYSDNVQNASGTGLGLSIVKRIVELMGGEIWVDSEPGKGAKFYFTVNVRESLAKPEQAIIREELVMATYTDLKNINILIAEDEIINYALLEEIFKITGAKIEWVKNGAEAVDRFSNNGNFNIVLMDLKMPVMSGYQAFEEIRKINKSIPVIAQTAYAMSGEKEEILKFGFNGYISKPIDRLALLNLVKNLLK